MPLLSLEARDLRLFRDLSLSFSPRLNVFYGENASGKTTILEAILLLATARSFRTRHFQDLFRHGENSLVVSGKVETSSGSIVPLGLHKTADSMEIRAGGRSLNRVSDLAGWLPVQLIHPDSHLLVSGGPKERRRFLDWGVFHVEHKFITAWRRYDRVLRQRNAALRQRGGARIERVWDKELEESAKILHQQRERYINELNEVLPVFSDAIEGDNQLVVDYLPGWDVENPLSQLLKEHSEKDRNAGFTYYGPHRTDLVFRLNGRKAQKFVSRGQQKMLVVALMLSQAEIYTQHTGRPCVILLDDLAAELDREHREKLLGLLHKMSVQVFITCTDKSIVAPAFLAESKMFHVKQGLVTEVV